MSGYVTSPSLNINLTNLESSVNREAFISFPSRTRITSMLFTVNNEARGIAEFERQWNLNALIGHPQPTEGNPFNESVWDVFGPNPKPVLFVPSQSFVSTVATTATSVFEVPTDKYANAELTFGVMEPNDYLYVWLDYILEADSDIAWSATSANIVITYEATNLLSTRESIQKFPFLD